MNKLFVALACTATVLVTGSCAKQTSEGKNEAAKRYFDAWRSINYPEARKVDPGYYLISETTGNGKSVGTEDDNYFVRVRFTSTDLDGNIQVSTEADVAKQLGTYDKSYYYGPKVIARGEYSLTAGLDAVIDRMNEGGHVKVIIPGWLNATPDQNSYEYPRYDSEEEYLKNCTGSNVIYDFTVEEAISNITKWEIDSLDRYASQFMPGVDTLKYGFYFQQTQEPTSEDKLTTGDVVYVNYTGRLLNGQVFDSTIADTAKVWNVYKSSRTYQTQAVYIDADDYTNIKLGDSSDGSDCVDGFAYCISQMKVGEKAVCIFYSGLGYNYSGSGNVIPGYSPLMFEIEIVSKK